MRYLFLNVMHNNITDKSVWAKITGQNGALPYALEKNNRFHLMYHIEEQLINNNNFQEL